MDTSALKANPTKKRRLTENEYNPETNANWGKLPEGTTPEPQSAKGSKRDAGIKISTLKQAWGKTTENEEEEEAEEEANKTQNRNDTPIQQTKELIENTHDQAYREMYAEAQRELTTRTIVVDPEMRRLRIEEVKKGNR